jgi:hypothetical protein
LAGNSTIRLHLLSSAVFPAQRIFFLAFIFDGIATSSINVDIYVVPFLHRF